LRELVNARDALIEDRVPALNRQAIAVTPLIKRQLAQRLREIEAIGRRLKTLRNADADLCQRFDILTTIPGVGEVTANVLVVETPELGRFEHAQAAASWVSRLSQETAARLMESDPPQRAPASSAAIPLVARHR
jgi:transposase